MKKFLNIGITIILVLSIMGCSQSNRLHGIHLPEPIDKKVYKNITFSDTVNYYIYYYDEKTINEFFGMEGFEKVTANNIDEITGYMKWFKRRAKACDEPYKYNYKSFLEEGDLYYLVDYLIDEYDDNPLLKYQRYNLFYVDVSECILYVLHVDI
ncbi:MAG: hypothetical protein E7267_06765 [Lachnospiraceae bacterium]|nr:hypothetical protein [Lachnospiraceae bacterium]